MPIPDKFHRDLQKLIEKANPQSMEEMQKLLNSLMGKPIPEMSMDDMDDMDDADKAREMVYAAHDMPIAKGRAQAKKALKLDPDCIEAYEYIGNTYQYYDKRAEHFEKGVEIGRRIFGGEFLKQNKGHFWGLTDTRPFMRCLAMLAESYYSPGWTKKAVELMEEMIELNPNDNQGIRYHLLVALLELEDLQKFKQYRKQYKENGTMMLYSDALALFMENGQSDKANKTLAKAFKENKYVLKLLLKQFPPDWTVSSYMFGTEEEAVIYLSYAWRAWVRAKGAKDWLSAQWERWFFISNTKFCITSNE